MTIPGWSGRAALDHPRRRPLGRHSWVRDEGPTPCTDLRAPNPVGPVAHSPSRRGGGASADRPAFAHPLPGAQPERTPGPMLWRQRSTGRTPAREMRYDRPAPVHRHPRPHCGCARMPPRSSRARRCGSMAASSVGAPDVADRERRLPALELAAALEPRLEAANPGLVHLDDAPELLARHLRADAAGASILARTTASSSTCRWVGVHVCPRSRSPRPLGGCNTFGLLASVHSTTADPPQGLVAAQGGKR